MYSNPVIPGFAPDPSVTFHGGKYYLVTSTFEYFPGVSLWSSKDLVNWLPMGGILRDECQLDLKKAQSSSGLYAAGIRVNGKGRFYMVTTNKYTHENFICHTDDINGEWSDPCFIAKDGIDPSLLFLPDGKCFYTSNGSVDGVRCIKGAFINPDTGELLEDFHNLTTGCGGAAPEGPHIYFENGYYYLMLAEGGTGYGHHEVILRSENIYGPYEQNPSNPILSHVSRKGHPIQAVGHADLIKTPDGQWYAVFLAIRTKPRPLLHHLGRETFLEKVTWKDGWPYIGHAELFHEDGPQQIPLNDYSFPFSKPLEDFPYLKVRVSKSECYIQDVNAKTLTLIGEESINTPLGHPTMLCFRQRGFHESMEVTLRTSDLEGRAGIASWVSDDYHYRLEASIEGKEARIALIRHIHDFEAVTEAIRLPLSDTLTLSITSDDENYHFHADGKYVGKATVYGLASEGMMHNAFTGALFAIYAENGKAVFLDGISMKHRTDGDIK
ncbi:MAG: family 43 glycosylhydrolase [Bullifex sp.]